MSRLKWWNVVENVLPLLGSAALVALVGCSGGPPVINVPSLDPDEVAYRALETYDADGDGLIAGEELTKAAGLNAAMTTLDLNKDGKVSEEEIAERVRFWHSTAVGITNIEATVTLDGRPLEGATVTFEPEPFLGEGIEQAQANSDGLGGVMPSIPKEKRPADAPPGLRLGFYKVRISKEVDAEETIPATYNTETILGQEISPDDPGFSSHRIRFDLKSN